MKRPHPCLCVLVALCLGLTVPVTAFADEPSMSIESSSSADSTEILGDSFLPSELDRMLPEEALTAMPDGADEIAPLVVKPDFIVLSDEMKYYAKYESGMDYDMGLSSGDGYHALGFYQLDNRYNLQEFLTFCYNYDPTLFSMFEPYLEGASDYDLSDGATWLAIRDDVDKVWHEAYEADPYIFSGLQDTFAYQVYYLPAERDLASRGIDISHRADCIKGLCWGMANLFGLSGWHRFVGGNVYVIENGKTVVKEFPGCGLSNDMSDVEFAVALTGYTAENVARFYPNQPEYHQGWTNRYWNEMKDCLRYLPDIVPGAWYGECVQYVQDNDYIHGYSGGVLDGRFGPDDRLTRGQAVTVLWRMAQSPRPSSSSGFSDVAPGAFYEEAVSWAREKGIVSGYIDSDGVARRFGPDDFVTRQDIAVILHNFVQRYGGLPARAPESVLDAFTDIGLVGGYARSALSWCKNAGLITGVPNADGSVRLSPDTTCSRAQFSKMIMVLTRDVLGW